MDNVDPYSPARTDVEIQRPKTGFRWRLIPVTFFAIASALSAVGTLFLFGMPAYVAATGNAGDWLARHAGAFLWNGAIGLGQTTLLLVGSIAIWQRHYLWGMVAVIVGFCLRAMLGVDIEL